MNRPNPRSRARSTARRWWWLLLLLPLLALGGFLLWANSPLGPEPEALAALKRDDQVRVDTDRWLRFEPLELASSVGLIVYPGGRVDPRAYAPLARDMAAAGYRVVIVPMPLNLAVLGADRAEAVMAAHPDTPRWVMAGHSLGGAMAARFARGSTRPPPDRVQGLVLWAAYPAQSDDLSGRELPVASIYATLDGLATPNKIEASRPLLPPQTRWVAIEGGNHAQFGAYGPQSGDNAATISPAEQQRQIVAATLDLLRQVEERER
jgi:pimeloyl-ACP methyl ester carboxylesterase